MNNKQRMNEQQTTIEQTNIAKTTIEQTNIAKLLIKATLQIVGIARWLVAIRNIPANHESPMAQFSEATIFASNRHTRPRLDRTTELWREFDLLDSFHFLHRQMLPIEAEFVLVSNQHLVRVVSGVLAFERHSKMFANRF